MKAKDIFISWDFWAAFIIAVIVFCVFPSHLLNSFTKDLYNIGISVLSIIFSVFFAALAIIISASDDDFVHFLEEKGDYTGIISTFKFTLLILFVALLYSIIMFAFTSYQMESKITMQTKWFVVVLVFLFMYGLFAAFNSTRDSIKYALYRTRYLKIKKSQSVGQVP